MTVVVSVISIPVMHCRHGREEEKVYLEVLDDFCHDFHSNSVKPADQFEVVKQHLQRVDGSLDDEEVIGGNVQRFEHCFR